MKPRARPDRILGLEDPRGNREGLLADALLACGTRKSDGIRVGCGAEDVPWRRHEDTRPALADATACQAVSGPLTRVGQTYRDIDPDPVLVDGAFAEARVGGSLTALLGAVGPVDEKASKLAAALGYRLSYWLVPVSGPSEKGGTADG